MRSAFLLAAGAVFSFGAIRLVLGSKDAMLEIPYIMAGIAGAVGPILLLFLWNLICAPYRSERDSRLAVEREKHWIEDGAAQLESQNNAEIEQLKRLLDVSSARGAETGCSRKSANMTELSTRQVDALADCLSAGRGVAVVQYPQSNAHLGSVLARVLSQNGWKVAN